MIQGCLLFILTSSLTTLGLSLLYGRMSPLISGAGLIVGVLISLIFYEREALGRKLFVFVIFIFCSCQFLYLFFTKNPTDSGFYTLNPNNIGDLPFHINMIRAFAGGLNFWPENPILVGETLKYPFGMNLFNAQLEILGIPLQTHLTLVGLGCLALGLLSLQKWMGPWGVVAFFFSGSDLHWKNLYLSVFVTQRGVLFAIPAGAYLFSELCKDEVLSRKKKMALGLIWGGLGFFHLHSFFIISLLLGMVFLCKRSLKSRMFEMAIAFAVALPFVLVSITPSESWVNPVRLSWGWMQEENENILFFLVKNFGAWLALLLAVTWVSLKRKTSRALLFSVLLLTLIFFNVMLAPWAWDQIKILMWCYLFLNSIIYLLVIQKLNVKAQIFIGLIIFFPGLIQVFNSQPAFQEAVLLFKKRDLEKIAVQLQNVSPNDRIYIEPRYSHRVFYFGKSVVMGYPGHIWSHGYSPAKLEEKIKLAVASGDPARFRELGARYILRDASTTLVKVPELQSE